MLWWCTNALRYTIALLAAATLWQLATHPVQPIQCLTDPSITTPTQHSFFRDSVNSWFGSVFWISAIHCVVSVLVWPLVTKRLPRPVWPMVLLADIGLRVIVASTLQHVRALPWSDPFTFHWTIDMPEAIHITGICLTANPLRFTLPVMAMLGYESVAYLRLLLIFFA